MLKARTDSGFSAHDGKKKGMVTRGGIAGNRAGASDGSAQRPRMRMPRPSALPPETQSIQPIVMGQSGPDSLRPAMKDSMSGTRRLSW